MFLHTLYTWILANLLHPLMFLLVTFINGNAPWFNHEIFEVAILFLVYSFCFSLPCLLLGWLTLYLILVSLYSEDAKFFLWLVTAGLLVILVFLIILFLGGLINPELLLFSFPGVAALSVSILIRYKQFKKLIHNQKMKLMKQTSFKKAGWIYLPIHSLGILITLGAIGFMAPVCMAVFRNVHSAGDGI